jgi:hypothetical protein
MFRYSSLLVMFFAIGCGGGDPAPGPTAQNAENPGGPNPAKLSEDEAKVCLTEYFSRMGLSELQLVAISHPVETPTEKGAGCAYSVTLKCTDVFGNQVTHNNWLVVVGVEGGKTVVKAHYDSMNKITEAMGVAWFAKAGFSEPLGQQISHTLPMPGDLVPGLGKSESGNSVIPAGFPLPDLAPPPSLPPFKSPR